MNINDLRRLCSDEYVYMTSHVFNRCREREITLDDIYRCILNGEIIEDYPDDYPYPSALVMECKMGKPIHVVAGLSEAHLWIITAYYPNKVKWHDDYRTRKELER